MLGFIPFLHVLSQSHPKHQSEQTLKINAYLQTTPSYALIIYFHNKGFDRECVWPDETDLPQINPVHRFRQFFVSQIQAVNVLGQEQQLGVDGQHRRAPEHSSSLVGRDPQETGPQQQNERQPAVEGNAPGLQWSTMNFASKAFNKNLPSL